MTIDFDFHTHNLLAPEGKAIINLPEEALLNPAAFQLRPHCLYSAGIHPWWTSSDTEQHFSGLYLWAQHPQVVAIGECGLDKLQGGRLPHQQEVFERQIALAEAVGKPMTVHCVKSFDLLLSIYRRLRPQTTWTIHGFRGKPELAQTLLRAGMNLSFGKHYNEESFALTPIHRRHQESDDCF